MPAPVRFKQGWAVNFRLNKTRYRKRFSYRDYPDPLQAARDYIKDTVGGRGSSERQADLRQLADLYLRDCELTGRKRASTLEVDTRRLRAILDALELKGISYPSTLNIEALRGLQADFFLANGASEARKATWTRQISIISAWLRWCVKRGYVRVNIAAEREFWPRVQQRIPQRIYTKDELHSLFQFIDGRYGKEAGAFFRALAYTGVRVSELSALKWEQVDFRRRTITIMWSKNQKVRVLPILPQLKPHLESLPHRTEYVLPRHRSRYWWEMWRDAQIACHVPHGRVHDLRHTFCTALSDAGVPLRQIMALAGHSQIGTTVRYAHAQQEQLRSAIQKIDY